MKNYVFHDPDWQTKNLDDLAKSMVEHIAKSMRMSPNGLSIRYYRSLIEHVAAQLPADTNRLTIAHVHCPCEFSVLHHLRANDLVFLWLIESMAKQHSALQEALLTQALSVRAADNGTSLRVEFAWDPSRHALHDAV